MANAPNLPEDWSAIERWVWMRLEAGQSADLNERDREDGSTSEGLDPKKADGWNDSRRLSVPFLQSILTEKPFVDAIPFKGVKILGALLDGDTPLDLAHARVERLFWLEKSRLLVDVECRALHSTGELSLEGSYLQGAVSFYEARIGGNLVLAETLCDGDVDLRSAKIDAALTMKSGTFNGKLDINGSDIGLDLSMCVKAAFKDVDLTGAKVGGQIDMSGSAFGGTLLLNSIEVGAHLFLCEESTFQEVDLGSAKVGGQLDMGGSTFIGPVDMHSATIGKDLFARDTKFPQDQEIGLQFVTIGSTLDLSGATIGAIDLSGATVAGELRLGSGKQEHKPPNWMPPSRMVLRNATVGALQDSDENEDCWPDHFDLEGFTFGHLGGFGAAGTADMGQRSSSWFAAWLKRHVTYSPQPYEQLAAVLRKMGYPSKADDILYAGRKRGHRQTLAEGEWLRWAGMALLRWTIGFGLGKRYFRSVIWVLLFTAIGVFVFVKALPTERVEIPVWLAGEQPALAGMAPSATASGPSATTLDLYDLSWASFDQLLPIVTLNKAHEQLVTEQQLPWWALYYFYFQKLVGWVLGSFLIAGFAGLTQKS